MDLAKIYEGWKNHLIPNKDMEELIKEVSQVRMDICNKCDLSSINKKNYFSIRQDVHCTDCGCTLIAKTKSMSSSCPKDKWLAVTKI